MGPGVPSRSGRAGSRQSWQPPARAACLHAPASSFPSLCAGAEGLCPPLGMLGAGGTLPVPLPVLLPILPGRHLPGNPLLSGCCFIFSAEKIELKAIAPPPKPPTHAREGDWHKTAAAAAIWALLRGRFAQQRQDAPPCIPPTIPTGLRGESGARSRAAPAILYSPPPPQYYCAKPTWAYFSPKISSLERAGSEQCMGEGVSRGDRHEIPNLAMGCRSSYPG